MLFGLRTKSGHWLPPAMPLIGCPVDAVDLRLRFRFPPYRVTHQGKLRIWGLILNANFVAASLSKFSFWQKLRKQGTQKP